MKRILKLSACIIMLLAYALLLARKPFSWVTFAVGIPVCTWLANLVHELGHLTAYMLLKLQWKRMVLSFFVFDAQQGFQFDTQRGIFAASCTCAYSPEVPAWRYCVALLSGGCLGGLVGIAAVLLSLLTEGRLAAFLQCFGLVSLFNAAVTLLLPFTTDRSLLRQIKKERSGS